MGAFTSTHIHGDPHHDDRNYLLGLLVGEKIVELHSDFWERLLGLPLLPLHHSSDQIIEAACKAMTQNCVSTCHYAKLLLHLAWKLEGVSCTLGSELSLVKALNAARFSIVFLKYVIEHRTNLESCLSLCLNEKDAEGIGLSKGNQNVAQSVVKSMLFFISNSDINSSTYWLHLEVGNLFFVMMSTQLYTTIDGGHIFLEAALSQDLALVRGVVSKLLTSYIMRLTMPAETTYYKAFSKRDQGLLHVVGSKAVSVLRLPYSLLSPNSKLELNSLAKNSLLLLLVLIHYPRSLQMDDTTDGKSDKCEGETVVISLPAQQHMMQNSFLQALDSARDSEFDLIQKDEDSQGGAMIRAPFRALYDTLGLYLREEMSVLLLYSLLHRNPFFLEYVLVRTDLDTLIMPLLETLYDAPSKTRKHVYMLLIILLILGQDASFNAAIHKLVLSDVPWYKERLPTQTTLGSLMVVILIRIVKYNLSKLRDVYLYSNCLAILSNMAPHVHKLNAYATERIVSLFEMLSHKYMKLENHSTNISNVKLSTDDGAHDRRHVPTEIHIYTDVLRIVLEIINAILTYALPQNPEMVYAILHKQEIFQPFRSHPQLKELMDNLFTVIDFFNSRIDSQDREEEWSVEKVLQVIIDNTRSWRGDGMKMVAQLRFTYEEEPHPEEFFVPYVWQLVVSDSGIMWNLNKTSLIPSKPVGELHTVDKKVFL